MLERFEFVEKIGQGGMAVVNRAYIYGGYGFKKEVVVKKILKKHFGNKRYLQMFVDEATLTARLNHANIVQVFDFFEEDEELYIVMELVDGGTLRDLIISRAEKDSYIPLEHTLFIINSLLEGMNYYHNKVDENGKPLGIIHRDLTPKNILVSIYGEVKISDFGIAKSEEQKDVTTFGEVKGKPSYLSPEQIKLLPNQNHQIDLFVLGIIFYELLTNFHPFKDKNSNNYLTQTKISEGNYKKIGAFRKIPSEIEKIVYKLLTVDRTKRYQHARDVKRDVMNLNHKISNQILFSTFVTEELRPDAIDYINNISGLELNSDSNDFRENKKKLDKKKRYFFIAVATVVAINLLIAVFAYRNAMKEKKDSIKIIKKHKEEQLLQIELLKENNIKVDDMLKEIKENQNELNLDIKDEVEVKDIKKEKVKIKNSINNQIKIVKKDKPKKIINSKITILVNPYGNIYIDGKLISEVSLINHTIKLGSHKLKIENKALNKVIEKVIFINSSKTTVLRFNLREK